MAEEREAGAVLRITSRPSFTWILTGNHLVLWGGGEVLISAASSPLQTTREELSQVVNNHILEQVQVFVCINSTDSSVQTVLGTVQCVQTAVCSVRVCHIPYGLCCEGLYNSQLEYSIQSHGNPW